MDNPDRVVAIGLITEGELATARLSLTRIYPVDHDGCFADLLRAIDDAERRQVVQARMPGPMRRG